jgi:hypothetical protein
MHNNQVTQKEEKLSLSITQGISLMRKLITCDMIYMISIYIWPCVVPKVKKKERTHSTNFGKKVVTGHLTIEGKV